VNAVLQLQGGLERGVLSPLRSGGTCNQPGPPPDEVMETCNTVKVTSVELNVTGKVCHYNVICTVLLVAATPTLE